MAKRVIKEDTISHERWLVSYADFLTLMLAFFVVMYSISQVNEGKYKVLSDTLMAAFNVPELSMKPIQVGDPVLGIPGNVDADIDVVGDGDAAILGGAQGEGSSEPQLPEEFRQISEQIEQEFQDLMEMQLVSVQGNEEWLEIELKSSMLFESGEAVPSGTAGEIIGELSQIVSDSSLPIRVEGFTDNVPIANAVFPSNWELSAARAASIVKLMSANGIEPGRLAAVGYGEHQPIADNATADGRAQNRRVVLMISRNARLRPQLPRPQRPAGSAQSPEDSDVLRLELEGGGLLFTNDPTRANELRERRAAQDNAAPASEDEAP